MIKQNSNIISDNINMLDVCRRMVDKRIRAVFDSSTVDEDGNVISFNEQAAIVTHYLQLENSGRIVDTYGEKAKGIIELWKSFMPELLDVQKATEGMAGEALYTGSLFDTFCMSPFMYQR